MFEFVTILMKNYPVRAAASLSAIIGVLPLFGVPLSAEQVGGLNLVVATILGVKVHEQVTPTIRLDVLDDEED